MSQLAEIRHRHEVEGGRRLGEGALMPAALVVDAFSRGIRRSTHGTKNAGGVRQARDASALH